MELKELRDALLERLRAKKDDGQDRRRLVYELGDMVDAVERVVDDVGAPERVRAKARGFLDDLTAKHTELGGQLFVPGWLLNVVGEAMARHDYVAEPVVKFISTGLYFYGLDYIERHYRHRAMNMMVAHADLVTEFMTRASLKNLVILARQRLTEDRPFCLVHHYVNTLKKRSWAKQRASVDACDRPHEGAADENSAELAVDAAPVESDVSTATPLDRVELMLRLFAETLTADQQRIYLWRHGIPGQDVDPSPRARALHELAAGGDDFQGKESWSDLAGRLALTDKTVKREYLKSLHVLLRESARVVFGELVPSNYVRRVLDTLRTVTQERDLKLRDLTGRGMGALVERWQIALRFVLNHERISAVSHRVESDRDSGRTA